MKTKRSALGAYAAGLLMLAGGTAWAGAACCGAENEAKAQDKACACRAGAAAKSTAATADAAAPAVEAEVKAQTLCPVMNAPINRNLYVDHDGKRIYVCCRGCLGAVKADPAKYIKQLEDRGVTLEKVPSA